MSAGLRSRSSKLRSSAGSRAPFAFCLLLALLLSGCGSRQPSSAGLVGLWEGTLCYPGLEVRVALHIAGSADAAQTVNLLRPDQTDTELQASNTSIEGESLRVEFESVDATFDGSLSQDGQSLAGEWKQGSRTWSVALQRVDQISNRPRPQTPVPPYPYVEEDATFTNAKANATLAGTLTLPNEADTFPAVILISGAGAQDRDATILEHHPFRVLADYLTRRGIAVLRYDDRGTNASTGDRSQATSDGFADDVLAGVAFLADHSHVDPNRIGLIGHSEGGAIALLAAARSPGVAFVVTMGTPGLPGLEYNLQFEESTARALGATEGQIAAKLSFQKRVLNIVAQATDIDAARAALHIIYSEIPNTPESQINATINHLLSPWFRYNLAHDPSTTLQQVTCPVLSMFGEKDVQVPPAGNMEAMRDALGSAGNADYQVVELDGLNHFFQTAATGSPLEYGEISETLAPKAMKTIIEWIAARTGIVE